MSFNTKSKERSDEYTFASLESYWGPADQVKKLMDECKVCNAKLVFNHLPDYKNLLIQENARCMECGNDSRKVIHILN